MNPSFSFCRILLMANHDIKCHDLLSRAKENFIDVSNKEKLSPKNGNMSPYMPKFFFYRLIIKRKINVEHDHVSYDHN